MPDRMPTRRIRRKMDISTSQPVRTKSQTSLPRRIYPFRVLGMGLASVQTIAVLHELRSPWPVWAWMVFSCLLWPHLAYAWARRSHDRFGAELRNLIIDSMIAGSWVPLMHFNLLPSLLLLAVATADKVNSGIRRLWLLSLPGMLACLLGVGVLTGFAFAPRTSMPVLIACLPLMLVHTLAVAANSYRLVRRVQAQNLELEALSRIDALTGLDSRGHWEDQATQLMRRRASGDGDASLILLDVDRFKDINDAFGHAAGDDVLRGIAELIRRMMPPGSHAGRLGGDEFALAIPAAIQEAEIVAERIRTAVEKLDFPKVRDLHCSISIGIAGAPGNLELREWIENADRALYRAKHAGRNRTMD